MNKIILTLALGLFSLAFGKAQDLEQEIEFQYIKAKYLLDTERYEDAIRAFTDIVKTNPSFKDALLLRAESKYAMAAYQGTKKDVLLFIEGNGIDETAAMLLGKSDYKMGNTNAALNSLLVASQLGSENVQVYEFIGNLYEEMDQMLKACDIWQKAAAMGSSKASINVNRSCGGYNPPVVREVEQPQRTEIDDHRNPNSETEENPRDQDEELVDDQSPDMDHQDDSLGKPSRETTNTNDNSSNSGERYEENGAEVNRDSTSEVINVVVENMPVEDNTPNEIVIDDDLTLIIRGQGLGKRRILEQPNILILSDEDGIVAVDICVNKRGKVESAEFNSKLSTIAKKSLVSLAIRKSKDFWFEKNDYKEQCGVIMFKIVGS